MCESQNYVVIGCSSGAIACVPKAVLTEEGSGSIFLLQEGRAYISQLFTRRVFWALTLDPRARKC